jgi:proteic killer suppression protein
MRQFGGANPHELKGDRHGQLAVNGKDPLRIVFIPDHDPLPLKPDGGLDWSRVTAIRITSIENYHRG